MRHKMGKEFLNPRHTKRHKKKAVLSDGLLVPQ